MALVGIHIYRCYGTHFTVSGVPKDITYKVVATGIMSIKSVNIRELEQIKLKSRNL